MRQKWLAECLVERSDLVIVNVVEQARIGVYSLPDGRVPGKERDYLRVFHACEVGHREGKTQCVEGKALAVDADFSDTSELYQHPSNVIIMRMRN
jgi:hypothetical protein